MSEQEGFHSTEPDAPEVEPKGKGYQLYYDDVSPCRWYLSVNGYKAQPITSHELNVQSRFRNWHLDHRHRPPQSEKVHVFEKMVEQLYDTAIKNDAPPPFLETSAGYIENLAQYFDGRIPNALRAFGQEFLDGKAGDTVRMKDGRIYFKWQDLKRFCIRVLNQNGKDVEALKMFISEKGGYQGEDGAREFYRWTYWVPLDIFEGQWKVRWLGQELEDGGSRG